MGVFSNRLHLVEGCGRMGRTIRLIDLSTIRIGCFHGTKAEAIEAVRRKYEGQEAEDYIQKVRECFEGTDDLDKIRHYATHPEPFIRWFVAVQGFELELLRKDQNAIIRKAAEQAHQNIETMKN